MDNDDIIQGLRKKSEKVAGVTDTLLNLVERWMVLRNVTISTSGLLKWQDHRYADFERIRNVFNLDYAAYRNPKAGITEKALDRAFVEYVANHRERTLSAVGEQLAHDFLTAERGAADLERFTSIITGKSPADPVDVAVLQQFIWQVKRKLFDRPVEWHLMPVLSGPQGSGKSVAVERLLAPVRALTLTGKGVNFVADERNYKALSEHYVCFFDEMSGASKADVDDLKQVISAKTNDFRPLHTNNNVKVAQNCTFIGVSNKDIRDLIRDASGMRRYYQLQTRGYDRATEADLFTENCRIINEEIDFVAIWQSVDENRDEAYTKSLAVQLAEHQEKIRSFSSVEEWLIEGAIEPGEHAKQLTSLYDEYVEFCQRSGRRDVVYRTTFSRELKGRGFTSTRRNSGLTFFISTKPANSLKVLPNE
jgi:hypothetical protein